MANEYIKLFVRIEVGVNMEYNSSLNCYDANGLHLSYRHNSCRNERKYLEDNLRRYHALMEANPSELEQYNEMEIH